MWEDLFIDGLFHVRGSCSFGDYCHAARSHAVKSINEIAPSFLQNLNEIRLYPFRAKSIPCPNRGMFRVRPAGITVYLSTQGKSRYVAVLCASLHSSPQNWPEAGHRHERGAAGFQAATAAILIGYSGTYRGAERTIGEGGACPLLPGQQTKCTHRLLQKSFWGEARTFLEPLMRFTRGDVRDHTISSKIYHASPPLR